MHLGWLAVPDGALHVVGKQMVSDTVMVMGDVSA